MSVALLTISDGRHAYHQQALASALEMLPKFDQYIWVDDREHALGFAGAIQHGWQQVTADWVMHFECDFTFDEPVDVAAIIAVLRTHPYLTQMALLRQPVNDIERAAGGVIEQHPDSYHTVRWQGQEWREHRRFWTTNPCVYPRWIVDRGWPQRDQSEGVFGIELFAEDPARRAAFWKDRELVTHIGDVRGGVGY